MWLLISICVSVLILGLIGHNYPRSPNTFTDYYITRSTLPDLRVSEFAPDLDAVPSVKERADAQFYKDNEKARSAYRRSVTRGIEDYYDKITEIKLRRMKEGNPVTKKNPIDPDEMPPKPYNHF